MRRMFMVAGLVLAVAAPATVTFAPASAEAASCGSRKSTGTVLGAVGGGLLGGAVTDGGLAGPLIGAGAGALVGREIGKSGCKKRTYTRSYRRAEPARYANSGPSCSYETRTYYDERGRPVQSPMRVCR